MSTDIYTKKNHYVYQITEISTNMKYIGLRSCKCEPINDIGIKYFSSSSNKEFIKNQKNNPDDYLYEIISIHHTRSAANIEEIRLHELYEVSKSDCYYNKSRVTSHHFTTDGFVTVKDKDGNIMQVSITDPRYISGELKHNSTGMIVVKGSDGNNMVISNDDPRYISGELKGIAYGFIVVKDNCGKNIQISVDDPRYTSGELVGVTKGRVSVIDPKTNKSFNIDRDDPRLLSGELVGVAKGRKKCFNTLTNKFEYVYPDDIRFTTGELVKHERINCMRNKNRDHNVGKKWYNNGSMQMISYDPSMLDGEGWVEGMLTNGKKWYNNGSIETLSYDLSELDGVGWVKGRLKKSGL